MQIVVDYQNQPVTFKVTNEEKDIYKLCLEQDNIGIDNDKYIPTKIVIRKKGKIWISDVEDYGVLVSALTTELDKFNNDKYKIIGEI